MNFEKRNAIFAYNLAVARKNIEKQGNIDYEKRVWFIRPDFKDGAIRENKNWN